MDTEQAMINIQLPSSNRYLKYYCLCIAWVLLIAMPINEYPLNLTDKILLDNQLTVAVRVDAQDVPLYSSRFGFELALAQAFARHLGVHFKLVLTHKSVYSLLRQGEADIAFTHDPKLPKTASDFSFSKPYLQQDLLPLAQPGKADEALNAMQLAWAYRSNRSQNFNLQMENFFTRIRQDGTFDRLYDQYFGHMEMTLAEEKSFLFNIHQRLPEYQRSFKKVAKKTQVDWRLLAAIGYQESHWDPEAISPTGVRGLMMLTRATATEMGVEDRHSAKESILGGSAYFRKLKNQLDRKIPEPHRTWMALAAYNMGIGHLEDARTLTLRAHGDPNNWFDVKLRIPLLQKPHYYSQVRNGYAMGARQSLAYVQNVRRYFDILLGYQPIAQADENTLWAMR